MRTVVDAKGFYEALKKASTATARTKFCDPMEQVCVAVKSGVCRLTGTDLSVWVSATMPSQGEDLSFVFENTKQVLRVCKHFSGALELDLTVLERPTGKKDMKIVFSCGERMASFRVFEDQGVHELPQIEESVQVYRVNAPDLCRRIQRIRYAASKTEDRPGTSGVRFRKNQVWCIDGLRMAVNESESLAVSDPFILPMSVLIHLKECVQTDAELSVGKKYAAFTAHDITLICRVLTANDTVTPESAIPANLPATCQINRAQFLNELKYLRECVGSASKSPVLFDGGKLFVFDNSSMFQTAVDVNGKCSDQYALDLRYITEALSQFVDREYVTLRSGGKRSPVVITAGGADTALIMPVRAAKSWGKLEMLENAA